MAHEIHDNGRWIVQYFLMPGGCKFGKDCKFAHDQEMNEEGSVELNFLGLPVRPVSPLTFSLLTI